MRSRYEPREASDFVARYAAYGEDVALRTYTSRLLGAEPSLVLHGGGNTSVKGRAREVTGEEIDALFVKGSGWDLATIEPPGLSACRLAPLLRCLELREMSDEHMVQALRSQMLDPSGPTPSVEALLHAFLPGKFVDHTHANAVLAVVDQPDGEARAREIWGDALLFVPYVMPGFILARRVFELGEAVHDRTVMVLDKHGIFTWGGTAEESYERMIAAVTRAEEYIAKRSSAPVTASVGPSDAQRRRRQRELAPVIRGALERAADGQKVVLSWRDEPDLLSLSLRKDAARETRIGAATPDHVIRTKPYPLFIESIPEGSAARAHIERALADYARWYEAYFAEQSRRRAEPLTRLDRLPRILLFPGLGALALGKTLGEARIAGDVYLHTSRIIADAFAIGEYQPVSLDDLFDVEYWSLEQAKLRLQKGAGGALARHVALVTGAARGIGRATAERLLQAGAHVLLSDMDGAALEETTRTLRGKFGRALAAHAADVTAPGAVRGLFDAAIDAFGGLDVVVSNAGTAPSGLLHTDEGSAALERSLRENLESHQLVAREAVRVLLSQGPGGCLLFNASKSAFNPGPGFGPYAVAKAAVIALMRQYAVDLGAHGIRSNAVNADRVHTALFSEGLVQERARARGVPVEHYFRENLLRRETTAYDVADAFVYLATAQATTGCVITVDGGNAAAFPR